MISRLTAILLLGLWARLLSLGAQDHPHVLIFDEDDPIGTGYYDASFGSALPPSGLRLGGPGDKMIIATNGAVSGKESGLIEWLSRPGGNWTLILARAGFRTADVDGYSNLVLHLNASQAIPAASLPAVGLESSPPDARSAMVSLAEFLPDGIYGDTGTWQRVSVPLQRFRSRPGFSLARIKAVFFTQGASDNRPHSLKVDRVFLMAGDAGNTNAQPRLWPRAPTNVIARAGDSSVVLHWDSAGPNPILGYHVYRRLGTNEPLVRLTSAPVRIQSFADLNAINGRRQSYVVRAVNEPDLESLDAASPEITPAPFSSDDQFLEYVQQTAFDYFWYEANPLNGLVRDRSDPLSDCSIAAVGFAMSAIGIGVDHSWISRSAGARRVLVTLRTLRNLPQGPALTGTIGYRGWFYHFLDMETGLRSGTTELSSIDTALLLAGVLEARQFFDQPDSVEAEVRRLADAIVERVDWEWMSDRSGSLTHGWRPESGFMSNRWIGYSEGMLLYLLGLGAANKPLPKSHWETWTSGYQWQTNYGQAFVTFPPLFGHQYSHCWVDFRRTADPYMRAKGLTYFENSRRATLAQRGYAISNPSGFTGYSSNLWGITACDGPGVAPCQAYAARGIAPSLLDDGTIAPTAAGGSLPFAPECALPALRYMYEQYRTNIWTGYGFRDAFNLQVNWWGPHVLGIDQGPILLMAENFRSGRVWTRFMRNAQIQRGLAAAGFLSAGSQEPEMPSPGPSP